MAGVRVGERGKAPEPQSAQTTHAAAHASAITGVQVGQETDLEHNTTALKPLPPRGGGVGERGTAGTTEESQTHLKVRAHQTGASLFLTAPTDQLFLATEINEWAWLSACGMHMQHAPGHPATWDPQAARICLHKLSVQERHPALTALLKEAKQQRVPALLDDDQLSLGHGRHHQAFALNSLPDPHHIEWDNLQRIPTALITGSNGKTTSVRLLAAMLRASGKATPHNCTDGLYFNSKLAEAGDYSGPAGARWVLRHPQADAAVIEAARGGMLRRGLAVDHVDAALVTNISPDHFGEYGIHTLDDLCDVKLIVARAVRERGYLVLNADDKLLHQRGPTTGKPIAWFSLDPQHPAITQAQQQGSPYTTLHNGELHLFDGATTCSLGPVNDMPLSMAGAARYNIQNLLGAALLAHCLGVPSTTIRSTLAKFGARREDNPGRLQHWQFGGITVFMDYAHNPEGLEGLLQVGQASRIQGGRLGLVLGQAGNRQDEDIAQLAKVAAAHKPERIALKDLDGYLRGRKQGDVPELLKKALLAQGQSDDSLSLHAREIEAVKALLEWARLGDVLVLPVHALTAQAEVGSLLDQLRRNNWICGNEVR
ncbi:Mur ligase family protein [Pseudomarimonas arenosa]|uniref:Mur ligase n=1 Tax=Pseudomarimonas arenosa TaxID=2774145 RepID=A0AAW3ZS86_9GAMM|nr:Mur ligase family protein [Pseudomarimonas arenosa]MBD8527081.1 Mur ligase [Pseudomarimonas arenosa]